MLRWCGTWWIQTLLIAFGHELSNSFACFKAQFLFYLFFLQKHALQLFFNLEKFLFLKSFLAASLSLTAWPSSTSSFPRILLFLLFLCNLLFKFFKLRVQFSTINTVLAIWLCTEGLWFLLYAVVWGLQIGIGIAFGDLQHYILLPQLSFTRTPQHLHTYPDNACDSNLPLAYFQRLSHFRCLFQSILEAFSQLSPRVALRCTELDPGRQTRFTNTRTRFANTRTRLTNTRTLFTNTRIRFTNTRTRYSNATRTRFTNTRIRLTNTRTQYSNATLELNSRTLERDWRILERDSLRPHKQF